MSKAAELANLIGNINAGGGSSNRNIFQNGAMNVSQRSTSETGIGSGAVDTYKTLDRVGIAHGNTDGRLTMTQDGSGPSGFANCLKLACTTADTSIAAGEYLQLKFKFEGQDLQTIKKGTSDAVPLTVSFYVKGNGNATYMCELEDHDNSRNNQQQFAVTSSWNRVSLTFVADTTGAFDDDNALSLSIIFWLHAGSTYTGGTYTANTWTGSVSAANRAVGISSFFSSTSNTFFLTGMQVEVGQNPTEFEHEPVERTLAKCQRYFQTIEACLVRAHGTTSVVGFSPIHPMRAAPSATTTGTVTINDVGTSNNAQSSGDITLSSPTDEGVEFSMGNFSSLTDNLIYGLRPQNGHIQLLAEL